MNALTLIPESDLQAIARLDDIVTQSQAALIEAEHKPMLKAILTARAMNAVRDALSGPLLEDILKLAGHKFGFIVDKDVQKMEEKQRRAVIRDVAVQALLDGARVVGNEFNVIAAGYYRTKEQLERRVREWPGISDVRLEIGIPVISQSGKVAICSGWASWKVNGVPYSLSCEKTSETRDTRIVVRTYEGEMVDTILGKAKRKAYHRIWEILLGRSVDDIEDRDVEAVATSVTTVETVADKVANGDLKAADPTKAAFQSYIDALEKCDMVRDAEGLYLSTFGPESPVNWTPEQDTIAKQLCDSHCNAIRAKRGPKK